MNDEKIMEQETVEWLKEKLASAESSLATRKGAVERMKEASKGRKTAFVKHHEQMAEVWQREVDMFRRVLAALGHG